MPQNFQNLNKSNKCIYIHIPKVAGISIEQALFNEKVGHKRAIDFLEEDENKFNEYFKFTFVRNPYDRLASAFYFLKNGGRNKFDKAWSDTNLAGIDDFKSFVLKLRDEEFKKTITTATHFLPQFKYLTDKEGNLIVDYIGKFESLNSNFDYVCKKLGKRATLPHKNKTINRTRYQELYNQEMQDIVYSLYREDFRFLNYKYNLNNDRRIFIHIGYPKAASTTLQKHLFNKHIELKNLGSYPRYNIGNDTKEIDENSIFIKDIKLKEFYDILTLSNDKKYNEDNVEHFYNKHIKQYVDETSKSIIFSNERFTSVFFAFNDHQKKAERLHSLFPDAKIIVVIRNQYDWLKSQYRDHPFDPGDFSKGRMVTFDEWFEILYKNENIKLLPTLNYYNTLVTYEELFGKENIGVFLFEELANNPIGFSKKISLFMQIESSNTIDLLSSHHENIGVGHLFNLYRGLKRNQKIKKFITRYRLEAIDKSIENLLKKSIKKDYSLSLKNQKILKNYYADSNALLMKKYNLDLKYNRYYQ